MPPPQAVALSVVEMARDGRFSDIEELFAPRLRAVVSADTLRIAWATEIDGKGSISAVEEPTTERVNPDLTRLGVPITCERGGVTLVLTIDDDGLLNGIRIAGPATSEWIAPSYAKQRKFDEHDVAVGIGPLAVPGTLSLPRGRRRRPAVVLLAGGGPFDRDETSGANKPLKDLAWGLASRGIAVLRFDLITYTHPARVADLADFTMTDEYVPHAVAAVKLLQQQPTVDPTRVFVLGHSMGGKVAPRVAVAEPSVAGLILLAADAQPMQRSVVRVARYLASLNSGPAAQKAAEALIAQAAVVDSPELSRETPASALPFGFSGSYWLDQRSYDPVSTAAALDKPVLLLQGGRDYQVTVDDDFSLWKAVLAHGHNATFRIYDADNHLFFPGDGVSTPAEYEPAQHVDPAVITDIAGWLTHGNPISRFLGLPH